MNVSALSLIAIVAAVGTAFASAQSGTVLEGRRHVRRNANARRQHRARQMRKLVDAMSVDPDPMVITSAPVPVPVPLSTSEPTPNPTDDTCDEHLSAYVGLDLGEEKVYYLKKGNCKDLAGNTYSYGETHDAGDFKDCAKECEKAMPTGLLGIDYTCSGKEQHTCHCLLPPIGAGATRSATDTSAFKKIHEGTGSGFPNKSEVKVGLEDFLNSGHDEVLCGTAAPKFQAVESEIAKEA